MEILKQGIEPKYKYSCIVCGCEFIVRFSELDSYSYANFTLEKRIMNCNAKCPVCGLILTTDYSNDTTD